MKKSLGAFLLLLAAATIHAEPQLSSGQQIYVPIYSSIFYNDRKRTLELSATLSVHNVDPKKPITLARVDYYDTKGKLLRGYLEKAVTLAPFETHNFIVEKSDTSGGTGANFLVEWSSDEKVVSPLVESLMVSVLTSQAVCFTSQGKVIKELGAKP
jgi:hypothetical protein